MARAEDQKGVADDIPANVPVVVPTKRGFPRAFGRYILEKNLSRGGMGEVHLAVARGVGTRCVIKTIRGDLTGDKEFIGRFADEAKIMVRINHPNIIRVFDCGKVGTDYYIAMEYVYGRDLGDVLDRAYERGEPMPKEYGLFLTREILKGLDYAHHLTDEHGRLMRLVHRDISPQNVLIGFDGSVKLIDFGLARTELLPARTQGALAVGKYGYMSPEQARHEKIDGRADIYSTGVMLFEVFTGDRLVDEQDQATLWARVLSPKHRRPSAVVSELPREIDELVMTAVAVKADDRFADAKTMLRFVDSLKTRAADKSELIKYLRYLYPTADFNPPPLPDLSGEVEIGEQSMVFAMSEEGAKSVFGRGQLPVEWTRQFKWADVQAELDKKKQKGREPEPKHREGPATDPAIDPKRRNNADGLKAWDDSQAGQEATVVHEERRAPAGGVRLRSEDESGEFTSGGATFRSVSESHGGDDAPTTIATAESFPSGTLADHAPTLYGRRSESPEPTAKLGRAAISSGQFRDDEQTVMMSAPPRNPAGWAGEEMSNDDVVAPTRVTHQTPGRASEPAPPISTAIPSDKNAGRRPANDRQDRAAGTDRTLPPTDRGTARRSRDPGAVVVRGAMGNEPTAPVERGSPREPIPAPVVAPPQKGANLMMIGIAMMGIAIVVLLLILIFWT
ncbi:MAG: protein kinase [Deltaproteobacteria bacterium]|nr:protein kinase [Deltaproteobacteria bacterium]